MRRNLSFALPSPEGSLDICNQRNLTLAIARDLELARLLDAALVHNPREPVSELSFSRSVHSIEEAESGTIRRGGARLRLARPRDELASRPKASRRTPRAGNRQNCGGTSHRAGRNERAEFRDARSATDSTVGPGSTPGCDLELEGRADVDGLAVAAGVLKRRHAVALDIVANAAGKSDAFRKIIRAADVERIIVALAGAQVPMGGQYARHRRRRGR